MHGPVAYLQMPKVSLKAGEEPEPPNALSVTHLQTLIEMVDSAKIVRPKDGGGFEIDASRFEVLQPGHRDLVAAAVARANSDPSLVPMKANLKAAEKPEASKSLDDRIKDVGNKIGLAADAIANIQKLVKGTHASAKWWGAKLDLSKEAATALSAVVGGELTSVLGMVAPFWPHAAMVLLAIGAAGQLLASWTKANNSGEKGVEITLYFWVVPWVTAR